MKKSLIAAVKKLLGKLGAEEVEGNDLVEVIDNGANALTNAGGAQQILALREKVKAFGKAV